MDTFLKGALGAFAVVVLPRTGLFCSFLALNVEVNIC